jgi:hypothetical protein
MKLFLVLLLSVWISLSFGQNTSEMAVSRDVTEVHLVFSQHEFGERFSVLTVSDENYDYYAVDLSKLGDNFEKVYFMNLTYAEPKIVNLDGDLNKDQTWFKTYYTNKESDITCLFKALKEQTDKASIEMSTEEKSAWMAKYNKFNIASTDE